MTRFRNNDLHLHNLVAAMAFFRCRGHSFFPQAKFLSALCSGRDFELRASVDGWDFNPRAQCGLHGGNGDSHINVIALAPKHRMLADAHNQVEIALGAAIQPGISLARNADALAVTRARLHPNFQWLGALDNPGTVADLTNTLRFARPMAARTFHVELHACAGLRDLPFALAFGADARRAGSAIATAVIADILTGNVE